MGWLIRVGRAGFGETEPDRFEGFEQGMNAGVTTSSNCNVTSTSGHTFAQLSFIPQGNPNAGRTTFPAKARAEGGNASLDAERVWQHVLSKLVGV